AGDSPAGGIFAGSLAAASAILLESLFSFALHVMPSALLLGCCLGLATGTTRRMAAGAAPMGLAAGRAFSRFTAIAACAAVGFAGWRGTQALQQVWPVERKKFTQLENIESRLAAANERWPSHELALRRASIFQAAASAAGGEERTALLERAVESYFVAHALQPFLPVTAVTRANALSAVGRLDESEEWFARAADLRGG